MTIAFQTDLSSISFTNHFPWLTFNTEYVSHSKIRSGIIIIWSACWILTHASALIIIIDCMFPLYNFWSHMNRDDWTKRPRVGWFDRWNRPIRDVLLARHGKAYNDNLRLKNKKKQQTKMLQPVRLHSPSRKWHIGLTDSEILQWRGNLLSIIFASSCSLSPFQIKLHT